MPVQRPNYNNYRRRVKTARVVQPIWFMQYKVLNAISGKNKSTANFQCQVVDSTFYARKDRVQTFPGLENSLLVLPIYARIYAQVTFQMNFRRLRCCIPTALSPGLFDDPVKQATRKWKKKNRYGALWHQQFSSLRLQRRVPGSVKGLPFHRLVYYSYVQHEEEHCVVRISNS